MVPSAGALPMQISHESDTVKLLHKPLQAAVLSFHAALPQT